MTVIDAPAAPPVAPAEDTDWMKPVLAEAIEKLRPGFVRYELTSRMDDGSYRYCARGAILSALTGLDDFSYEIWQSPAWKKPIQQLMEIERALGFTTPTPNLASWNNSTVKSSDEIIERLSSLLEGES